MRRMARPAKNNAEPACTGAPLQTLTLSRLARVPLVPLWVAQLATRAKSFERNPVIGCRALNRLGLHAGRVRLAVWAARARRLRLARLLPAAERQAIDRDGFVVRHDVMPPQLFLDLVAQVKAYNGIFRELTAGDTIIRHVPTDPRTLAQLPALRMFLAGDDWRGLLRYVGARNADPVVRLQVVFNRACMGAPDTERVMHCDSFHPTGKAWLFLTDVGTDTAPFVYMPGSHRLTAARLVWQHRKALEAQRASDRPTREGSFRVTAAELKELGATEPHVFAVPANTLVVADTFGFHARGASAKPSVRFEIFFDCRRTPFARWSPFDLLSVPALGWCTRFAWRLRDLLEAVGLHKNWWRSHTCYGDPLKFPAADG